MKLRSGEEFVDQFIERTKNKRVIFKNHTTRQGDIKSFVPWGSNSPNSNRVKQVKIKEPKVQKATPAPEVKLKETIKKKSMRRNATDIVRAYYDNPSRFALTDFERGFITETYMPSGTRRLSSAAVVEKFFPDSSSAGASYKTWKILDKILEQMTAPQVLAPTPSSGMVLFGKEVTDNVPEARLYEGSELVESMGFCTSDMNVAAAILCFGYRCIDILGNHAGKFEFIFNEDSVLHSLKEGFYQDEVHVSARAMAYNLKTLRAVIARWYKN